MKDAKNLLLFVEPEINPFYFTGKAIIFLIILVWGFKFIIAPMESNYAGESFLHLINLPFHEAGHIVFRPFGRIITSLGGTLGQLIVPIICLFTFLIKSKDTFGASVSLWWFAENFMDIAPYINDARDLKLMLVGGNTGESSPYGFHDWEFILGELRFINYYKIIANAVNRLGIVLMIVSFMWAGYLLYMQYKNLQKN